MAQDLASHRLVGAGRDGGLGTRDDVFYQLAGATYDAESWSVALSPRQLLAVRSRCRPLVRGGTGGLTGRASRSTALVTGPREATS